jgi:hypothetical protein
VRSGLQDEAVSPPRGDHPLGAGVTCVRGGGQGLGAEGSGPEALVKVERPQRSEDVRP